MLSHNKNEFTAKKKLLSIHINTDHVGPHGMPLVYGSTGSIKGSVCFLCNYDCKGRDIQVIYEAWTESHYTVNHKRLSHHQSKEVFGHQVWAVPLIHTKHNGSTVVAGVYEKEFEIPLTFEVERNRRSFDSATSESLSTTSSSSRASTLHSTTAPTSTSKAATEAMSRIASIKSSPANKSSTSLCSISTSYRQHGGVTLLPSSQYSTNTKVKYRIRAVLSRPFPSLSNVEASQEIWVENSAMSPPSLSYSTDDCDKISTTEQDTPSSEPPQHPNTVSIAEGSPRATLTGYEPSSSGEPDVRSRLLSAMPTAPYIGGDADNDGTVNVLPLHQ